MTGMGQNDAGKQICESLEGGNRSMKNRTYIAIDLKSFYASVECRERGLDPLDTHLVVADESRTDKTICLAVTPVSENVMAFPAAEDSLKSGSASKKPMQAGAMMHQAALAGSSHSFPSSRPIPPLPLTSSLRRPAWPIIWNTVPAFIRCI